MCNRVLKFKVIFAVSLVIVLIRIMIAWYFQPKDVPVINFYPKEHLDVQFEVNEFENDRYSRKFERSSSFDQHVHRLVVEDYYKNRDSWDTSALGTLLFKNPDTYDIEIALMAHLRKTQSQVSYKILVWKVGPSLEARHIYNYGKERKDPFRDCDVKNCVITYNEDEMLFADAVLIHLQKGLVPGKEFHKLRPRNQRWIFLTDESPEHTFIAHPQDRWKGYSDLFNWSMSYRYESDIPVPYGRTVPLENQHVVPSDAGLMELIPHWPKRRDVLVAILISNCSSKRMTFVRELMKYVRVEVLGRCAEKEEMKNACPGHFHDDCPAINGFVFYLAFENSRCPQYITEKVFFNSYSKGSIPVIIGTDEISAQETLPPFSYIYADNFTNAQRLGNYLKDVGNDEEKILSFHSWRRHFEVVNEHGYFKTPSVHYCRVCEALNYNSREESVYSYEKLAMFLDQSKCVKSR